MLLKCANVSTGGVFGKVFLMRNFWRAVVLFSGVLFVTAAQAQAECVRCHDEVPASTAEQCSQCHAFPVAAQTTAEPVPHTVQAPRIESGMGVPMLSSESRLGSEPNPMVLVPEGEFIMGTNERLADEGPQHKVKLKAFLIDKFEVTNFQYEKFVKATNRRSPIHFRNRTFPEGKADHPVINVTWDDARDYCAWAGKRLPTDQEWEKAARGADGRTYPWGNNFDWRKANVPARWKETNMFGDTTPVGAFEAGKSPYGVYDMSGNVWEWTDSWYQPYPGNKVPSENYGERYKVLKGGSWFDCSFYQCGISAPVFNRAFFAIKTKNDSFGFRCAKDAK